MLRMQPIAEVMWLITAMNQKQLLIARSRLEQLPQLCNVRGIPLPLLAELMGPLVTGLHAIIKVIVKADINVRVVQEEAQLHADQLARVMIVLSKKPK